MDRITVVRSSFIFSDTDESVDRLVVMLILSLMGSPSSSLKIWGKLSSRGNRSCEW